jgi:hypothetical protein
MQGSGLNLIQVGIPTFSWLDWKEDKQIFNEQIRTSDRLYSNTKKW